MNFTIAAHVVYNESYIYRWCKELAAQEFEQFFVWNWRFGLLQKKKVFKKNEKRAIKKIQKYLYYILLIYYLYVLHVVGKMFQI